MSGAGRIAIVGATGGLGREVARAWSGIGGDLLLSGTNLDALDRLAADLRARTSAWVETETLDLTDLAAAEAFGARAAAAGLSAVVVAAGLMPAEEQLASDPALAAQTMAVNHDGPAALARGYRLQSAILVLPGSVAGVRLRPSNRRYGVTKRALAGLAASLEHDLRGPRPLLLVMGPLDTPMAWPVVGVHARGALDPAVAARSIVTAIRQRRTGVLYLPARVRLVALILRLLPEPVVQRLRR